MANHSILKSFECHLPELYEVFSEGNNFYNTENEQDFIEKVFPTCKNVSLDYGIMEKSENVFVYPSDFSWSDLGTWSSLASHVDADKNNNAVISKQVFLYQSENNIVRISEDKVAVLQGLEGYIVVDTKDALLICKKEEEQRIKQFVTDLNHLKR